MLKPPLYAAALTLVAALFPIDYASARAEKVTHVDSTLQFPQGKRTNFRHTIRLHIPQESEAISQLIINVPTGLTVKSDITVTDQSEKQIKTQIAVNGSKVLLLFSEPVTSGTKLDIALNNVTRTGVSNAWIYQIYEKLSGSNVEILIGIAQFRTY